MAVEILNLITALGIPVGGTLLTLGGKWILAGQKDIKEDIANNHSDLDSKISNNHTLLDRRLSFLEAENRTFMCKDDLVKAFEHEKNGRKAIEQAATHLIEKNIEDIVKLRCDVARLDQNDTNLTTQFNDLKSSVEKGFDKTDGKLERISNCLAEISKKVT